jgi:lipopolysaccharide biosynthesis regulator YciM
VKAQEWNSPELEQMYQQGILSLNKGDAAEACAIFQKMLPLAPQNLPLKKSLAKAYRVLGKDKNALVLMQQIMDAKQADAECYKIASNAYHQISDDQKAQEMLTAGLHKFPEAGLLYYEMGFLFKEQKQYDIALKHWLDGIRKDPNYQLNYYEAAIAYVQTNQVLWAILYAEMFINKESATQRASDMRTLLLDAYHKFYFTPDLNAAIQPNQEVLNFEDAVKQTYLSLFFVVSDGINTENLIMLRTRFNIYWLDHYAQKYPCSLFAYHEKMIQNGYFDVYNQWLFGATENPQQYATWSTEFATDLSTFEKFRQNNPLVLTASDAYNTQRNFKGLFELSPRKASKR